MTFYFPRADSERSRYNQYDSERCYWLVIDEIKVY